MVKSPFPIVAAASLVMLLGAPSALARSAPTGGTSPSATAPTGASQPGAPAVVLHPPVIVTGGAVVVRVRSSALLGRTLYFHGSTPAWNAGQSVVIQRQDPASGHWLAAASARVGQHGGFLARWRTNLLGRVSLRAVVGSVSAGSARRRRHRLPTGPVSSTTAQITVYSPALATYFGPGFYGRRTACGELMSTTLIGVANRTLPCGTLVDINYNNRDITVPVVDRGPYANGADWDLTSAAAQAVGMTETQTIGTIVAGSGALSPQSAGSPPPSPSASGGTSAGGG